MAGEGRALVRSIPARCGVRRYNHLVLARSQIQEVFPLAACPRLAENSRLGFGPVASTSQWASGFSISSNTLGLSASLYDGRVRPRSTGKERDTESGNDYFGARYYASSMGRFMSPDWSVKVEPVPYAKLDNPQSLNLYAYVLNNPLSRVDPDGHCGSGSEVDWLQCSGNNVLAAAVAGQQGILVSQQLGDPVAKQTQAQQQGNVEDRVIIGAAGAANVYVGADKAAASVVAAISTPVTTGAGAVAAAYEGYQAAGQMAAGVTQLAGAITGHTEKANQEADNITIHSSAVAMVTLAATKDKTMAVNAAAFEGMASSSITRTVFKNAAAVVDTVSNFLQVLFSSKPPVPSQ